MAQAHHRPADGLLDAAVDRGLRGRDPRHLLGSVKAKTHIVGQGDSPLELLRGLLLDLVKQGEQGVFLQRIAVLYLENLFDRHPPALRLELTGPSSGVRIICRSTSMTTRAGHPAGQPVAALTVAARSSCCRCSHPARFRRMNQGIRPSKHTDRWNLTGLLAVMASGKFHPA